MNSIGWPLNPGLLGLVDETYSLAKLYEVCHLAIIDQFCRQTLIDPVCSIRILNQVSQLTIIDQVCHQVDKYITLQY